MSVNAKQGVRARERGFTAELKELQKLFSRALVGIESRLSQQSKGLTQHNRILNALVELVGADAVQEAVDRQAREEAQNRASAEKAALDEAIADGYVTPAETVNEKCIIVGHETDAQGKLVGTGRQQLAFRSIDPSAQKDMLGKKVGDKISTPVGGEFEIKEIYFVDEEKGRAILTAKAQKAAEEAAASDEVHDTEEAPAAEAPAELEPGDAEAAPELP